MEHTDPHKNGGLRYNLPVKRGNPSMNNRLAALTNTTWHVRLFFSAYIFLVPILVSMLLPEGQDGAPSIAIALLQAGEIITLATCAVASLRGISFINMRLTWPLAAIFLTTGTIPYAMGGFGLDPGSLPLNACSLLLGIGRALAFLLWASIFSRLGIQKAVLYGCATCLCAGLCAFFTLGLKDEWIALAALVSPAASLCAWRMSTELPDVSAAPVAQRIRPRASYPWRPIAIMSIAGFSAGAGTATSVGHSMTLQAVPLAAIGLATLAYVLLAKCLRFDHVLKGSLIGYAVGFIGQAIIPHSSVPGYLIFASYWGLCLFAFCILCKAAHEEKMPAEWLFGIGFSISEGIQLIGYALSRTTAGGIPEDARIAVLIAASLILALGMIGIWHSEHSKVEKWAASIVSKSALEEPDSEDRRIEALCRRSTMEFGLTGRETEVLALILKGKTSVEIAQELFVSNNTVKTHCKHIYAKCDVHSKQELRGKVLSD